MTFKRILYILLVVVVAGLSGLGGAVAGGYGVYQAVRNSAALPVPVQAALPANSTHPVTTLTLNANRYSNRDHRVCSKSRARRGDSGRHDSWAEHILRFERKRNRQRKRTLHFQSGLHPHQQSRDRKYTKHQYHLGRWHSTKSNARRHRSIFRYRRIEG